MVWLALALIGLVVLMSLVVTLGTVSTNRYEREQRARAGSVLPVRQPSLPPRQSISLARTT